MKYVYTFLILLISMIGNSKGFLPKFQIISNNSDFKIRVTEDNKSNFSGSLVYSLYNDTLVDEKTMIFNCRMDYEKVGIILNWSDLILTKPTVHNTTVAFYVDIVAKRLGGSFLICSVHLTNSSMKIYEERVAQLVVSRIHTVAELIFRIIVSVFVIFLTFVMGCGLDREIIIEYLKKPISPLIGFVCQFVFMPIVSASLGKLTGIDSAFGLGLLTIGCSPGGGASNVWTILFGGDLNLSITMTFVSSCAALGMMPLWMFLLSRFFIDPNQVQIPYGSIGLNLLQIVVPVGFGMLVRWKWNDKAIALAKKVKMMGLVFVIFILTFGSYANFYVYELIGDYIYLLPIGALLPWLGFLFGFVVALVTRRTKTQAIAIALETGFQNIGIALLILKFSMPQPGGDLGSVMPIIVALFTPMPLYFGYIAMVIKKYIKKKNESKDVLKMNSVGKDKQTF